MANKQTNVYVESFGFSENRFKVFSDLAPWEMLRVEGVHNVSDTLRDEGYDIVTIDKRYSIKEVLAEIKKLGEN